MANKSKDASFLAGQQIREFLENIPPQEPTSEWEGSKGHTPPIPPLFGWWLGRMRGEGKISEKVYRYYLNLGRGDSTRTPGQLGQNSLLEGILKKDALSQNAASSGSGWRPGRVLGIGGYGEVILWEKKLRDGTIIKLATKDSSAENTFFKDYNNEGHLTRRLNDAGCLNAIKVVDWLFIRGEKEDKFRTCFEYAEHGDLFDLDDWYWKHKLVFPEAFIWHTFHSIANALCFCRYGTNEPDPEKPKSGWDQIIHGDVKRENILMSQPNIAEDPFYPCLKLADFGLAYSIGDPVREVTAYKSVWTYGTPDFQAPEVATAETRRGKLRRKDMHGSHSDVYSLGMTIQNMCYVAEQHLPALRGAGVAEIYSDELLTLCRKCCATHPLERPKIHDLYLTTKSKLKFYQYLASIERAAAYANLPVSGGMYHSKVLWSAASQRLFEENMTYRDHYVAANLGLVRAAAKGLPRPYPYSSSFSLLPPLLIPPPPPLPSLAPKPPTTKPITKRRKSGSAPLTTTTILDYPVPRAAFSAPPLRPKKFFSR